ncbi:hypothetical protein Htur_4860 (plasmid) [Haloterrigena turkmenica DSM 5511]|uniref:Uncharacterized protein n=1 Tax=Haloterrigena turkmenica (strain ATCC 51198 / DSM 5511 / JCM 9101 / NCIMB 13204 / VKM B-1734 / 4k) TaxID=543526 RepID=D2S2M1_HALTV|nr:hypothetical protein Htur_4860 [Haloterrigena turkmenica DSM 5511]
MGSQIEYANYVGRIWPLGGLTRVVVSPMIQAYLNSTIGLRASPEQGLEAECGGPVKSFSKRQM